MRALRVPAIIAGGSAIVLASLLVASPAVGATLPEGQRITVSTQNFVAVGPPSNVYYDVNPAGALSTQVGSAAAVLITSVDVNDDGVGYGLANLTNGNEVGSTPGIYPVNAATGVTSPGGPVVPVDPDVDITECTAIDVQPDGTIIIACLNAPDNVVNSYLGTVTPAGAFTVLFDSQEEEDTSFAFTALAIDPTTGQLWAFAGDDFWAVDRSGATWSLGNINGTSNGFPVWGADFDRDGQLFVTTNGDSPDLLGTLSVATGELAIEGVFNDGEDNLGDVQAITVWGKKALAATGSTDVLPLGLATVLLMLAGAAFIATGRIQRRAA